MKKFAKEFKEFVLRGNVMDLAVGVIIGAAFGNIVTALTDDFINPLISSIGGVEVAGMIKLPWVNYEGLDSEAAKALSLDYGHFITTIVNFLIMALCIFLMVKAVNKLMSVGKKPDAPADPTTKECPFCKSEISIEATRCPHCTSELPEDDKTEALAGAKD
ncbi:MAG: large conductance mechanosensitive channel protein MscL [Clostridia bacterium]|nr:large conductance mechanosensitive channel protein MscL [Clostridia bacterium]MBR3552652.1 large conductance mechanosensitive channel protein MscL [Clostridia bacterium]